MSERFSYSVAIRTLGTAGEKYLATLESLNKQTIKPEAIIVYIAEGYELPKETIGVERYVYVKKGMVAQRALKYDEIDSEYILFTDDDVYYPPTAVEEMYKHLKENNGGVIAPDPLPHDRLPFIMKLTMIVFMSSIPKLFDTKTGYGLSWWGSQTYRNNVRKPVYESVTNAGMCFLCKKSDFLSINFEEDLWMDELPYALGDDQLMYCRMHSMGLKVLTWYNSGIRHLDAGSSTSHMSKQKRETQAYCLTYIDHACWWRYLYRDKSKMQKVLRGTGYSVIRVYRFLVSLVYNFLRFRPKVTLSAAKGIIDAQKAINCGELFNFKD